MSNKQDTSKFVGEIIMEEKEIVLCKVCTKCKETKPLSEYYAHKKGIMGKASSCKKCCIKTVQKTRLKSLERYKEVRKANYYKNRERDLANSKRWNAENYERLMRRYKEYRSLPSSKALRNKTRREKYANDISAKLLNLSRCRLNDALRAVKAKKTMKTMHIVGCDLNFLKEYIEKQFTPEMSWSNHGSYWQLDHIRPCASFNLHDEEELKKCFHYTNLQPLTKTENNKKRAKYEFSIQ